VYLLVLMWFAFLYQEKELLEKHNVWLDEELKAKVKNLAELRKTNMDEEARLSASIAEASLCDLTHDG
jgi:hypothetical protein